MNGHFLQWSVVICLKEEFVILQIWWITKFTYLEDLLAVAQLEQLYKIYGKNFLGKFSFV
jgi:hypothetical protein